ncbi:MAG: membrane protein insertase YidC [Chitinophagaceae bacterium]|nr:membrane protein insertase YidC [Chitinophagaceae bacterium]
MKFDRNTVLGFLILGALFIGYFIYTSKSAQKTRQFNAEQAKLDREKFVKDSLYRDSLDLVKNPKRDSIARAQDSIAKLTRVNTSVFKPAGDSVEKTIAIDNQLMRITFTNRGGQIKRVELKNYKGQDSNWVRLAGSDFDKISYRINSGQAANSGSVESGDQIFGKLDTVSNADGSKKISYTLTGDSTTSITHEFIVKKDDYMIDFNVKAVGANRLFDRGEMNLTWQYAAAQQESDISYERQNTQVGYVKDGSFDYHTIGRRNSKEFNESTKWIGVRQRFFFGALIARDNFSSGKMVWTSPADSAKKVVQSSTTMKLSVSAAGEVPFSIYYGPSDYHILKGYGMKFEKIINLGQGIYSFVRPLNKFLILPVFDLMKSISGGNFGIAILLLTIIIRLLISPLTYKSYLSGAKMKALRPEIAALKDKFGNDRQAMSMEQMKLFREAGVNPLGGCIPALLQIPIFFALFSFFNSEVDLRGASFLWANDLAAFDDPIKFGFHIPLLGSHLSLFNITACATSFLISWYSMSMTPDQSNPVLKYMPYIFPVFLLFFFNRLPSGLTWYYTVSNLITLILQYVIQNYIIDHNKILAKIEENRKKPKTKSKWQERMEQMQEQQKKMKEAQKKNRR